MGISTLVRKARDAAKHCIMQSVAPRTPTQQRMMASNVSSAEAENTWIPAQVTSVSQDTITIISDEKQPSLVSQLRFNCFRLVHIINLNIRKKETKKPLISGASDSLRDLWLEMEIPDQDRIKRNTCCWLELSGTVGGFMFLWVCFFFWLCCCFCLFLPYPKHLKVLHSLWETSNNNKLFF